MASTGRSLSRRSLLRAAGKVAGGLALASSGLWIPRRLQAADTNEHKFLFVFARGGWDTTYCFTPMFGNPYASVEDDATEAEVNGITFVDNASRPSVRSFFETWGSQVCLLNGIEIRSVTHERCRRIVMTGSSDSASDDWPSTIASMSENQLTCPHLVVAGPAFTAQYTNAVVRVGSSGQLPDLLDGSAVARGDMPVPLPDAELGSLQDAFVKARAAKAVNDATRGRSARFQELYAQALDQMEALGAMAEDLDLGKSSDGCQLNVAGDAAKVLDCFELGLSRCGIVESRGWCDSTWDTHSSNDTLQDINFEQLFAYLDTIMADLNSRVGTGGGSLADEVTVVVISEMGREPTANQWGGKNHWTYTSAMLIGAGVQGGRVIGRFDDNAAGVPIDLSSGDEADSGTLLQAGHLGATLYALAGLDPVEINPQYEAIKGAIREG